MDEESIYGVFCALHQAAAGGTCFSDQFPRIGLFPPAAAVFAAESLSPGWPGSASAAPSPRRGARRKPFASLAGQRKRCIFAPAWGAPKTFRRVGRAAQALHLRPGVGRAESLSPGWPGGFGGRCDRLQIKKGGPAEAGLLFFWRGSGSCRRITLRLRSAGGFRR